MVVQILLLSLAFVALVVGTITDIKTREVPDWVNYGLIFSALGIRLIYSSLTFDWMFFVYGLYGLIICVIIAYMMFYAGQWGGGDSKLLMALGALIGFKPVIQPFPLLFIFLINILVVGSIYGLIYSTALLFKHRKSFIKNFKKIANDKKFIKIRRISLIILVILLIIFALFIRKPAMIVSFFVFLIIAYLTIYLVIFIKSVEAAAMFKFVEPEKITEGDWIAKKYYVDGEYICGPKDLGISKKQIKQLIELKEKRKIKKIKIKHGIPFVPSFLIAFVITILFGTWWMFLF